MSSGEDGFRYLSAREVERSLPDVGERLSLARRAMIALVADAEMPAKLGVHPRGAASFAHAMPALLRGDADDGSRDLLGMKWVVGFPGTHSAGTPALHSMVLMNDARTGVLRAVLGAAPITAHRTAAVSGVALAAWCPEVEPSSLRVALLGAGNQARSHLPVLGHLLRGATLVIADRHPDRAAAVAQEAGASGAFRTVEAASSTAEGARGADVVITLVSFGPARQGIPAETFASAKLVVAVDYDMCLPASVVQAAGRFIVDDRGQFLATRSGDVFRGYPDPKATIGEALLAGEPKRYEGVTVVTHLGAGVADLVFADAVLQRATQLGLGTRLPA